MPKYRVQVKQGSKTMVQHIEAKSVDSVLAFYNTLSTARVTEILKVEYEDSRTPPVDDFQYNSLCKIMIANTSSNISKQVIINNLKITKDENDIVAACKAYLEIDGLSVNSCYSCLVKP